jgi:hypothetical protein
MYFLEKIMKVEVINIAWYVYIPFLWELNESINSTEKTHSFRFHLKKPMKYHM